jgi:hypothetical protein
MQPTPLLWLLVFCYTSTLCLGQSRRSTVCRRPNCLHCLPRTPVKGQETYPCIEISILLEHVPFKSKEIYL